MNEKESHYTLADAVAAHDRVTEARREMDAAAHELDNIILNLYTQGISQNSLAKALRLDPMQINRRVKRARAKYEG